MSCTKGLVKKNIFKKLKGRVGFAEPLKKYTTFKIGGLAQFFIEPQDFADLKSALVLAKRYKIPVFVIGTGSNILISDEGIDGLILHLNSPLFKRIYCNRSNCLSVGSGLRLSQFIKEACKRGLSGLEFLVGIPGTVGGALAMNAGCWGKDIGDLVERAVVMDYNGNIKILNKKDIKFAYRKSSLAKYIILNVTVSLTKKNKEKIKEGMRRYLKYRHNTQDTSLPNAGCIFKNPPSQSAGRLIDLCGLKGKRIGDARVSKQHANFILNSRNALSTDVLKLMSLIKERVKLKFGINLEPEIKIWQ